MTFGEIVRRMKTEILHATVEFVEQEFVTPLVISSGAISEITEARVEVTVEGEDAPVAVTEAHNAESRMAFGVPDRCRLGRWRIRRLRSGFACLVRSG